jgi:hypothetical protein
MEPTARVSSCESSKERPRRGSSRTLGDFRSATDDNLNSNTGVAKHGDKGIDTETLDFAANEVADPGLGHAEESCGLRLRQPTAVNHFAESNHEIRPDLEILGFRLGESEIAEDVPA